MRNELLEDMLPGNAHPGLEHAARFVRQNLRRTAPLADPVYILDVDRAPRASLRAEKTHPNELDALATRKRILEPQRCVAPAAYVGRPQVHWWWVYEDQLGRHIADDRTYRATDPRWGDPEPNGMPPGKADDEI